MRVSFYGSDIAHWTTHEMENVCVRRSEVHVQYQSHDDCFVFISFSLRVSLYIDNVDYMESRRDYIMRLLRCREITRWAIKV